MTIAYNANYIETLPFSDTAAQVNMTANSQQTFTVPGTNLQQFQAYFSYNCTSNVFVCLNAVPVVPGAGSTGTQPYCEFKPIKRYVRGGDVIHFISPDAAGAYAGVSLRQLQG